MNVFFSPCPVPRAAEPGMPGSGGRLWAEGANQALWQVTCGAALLVDFSARPAHAVPRCPFLLQEPRGRTPPPNMVLSPQLGLALWTDDSAHACQTAYRWWFTCGQYIPERLTKGSRFPGCHFVRPFDSGSKLDPSRLYWFNIPPPPLPPLPPNPAVISGVGQSRCGGGDPTRHSLLDLAA